MVALNATIVVRGQAGERRVSAADFFTGIYETVLSAQELLVAVELPVAKKNSAFFFDEFARRHGDYAIVGLAAQALVDGDRFADLRLAFFAVGDRPVLARAATKLVGMDVTPAVLSEASSVLNDELDPPEDQQASASMRRHLAKVLLRRCVSTLLGRSDLNPRDIRVIDSHADLARCQRYARRCACSAAPQSGGLSARAPGIDGHACRLRARGLRRMHGARQRCDRSFLSHAGGADARRFRRNHRRLVRQRRDRRSAGRVSRSQRAAMRLLHAGNAGRRAGSAEIACRPRPGADTRASFGQLLPLHRLPGHCRRGRDDGAGAHGRKP